MTSTTRRGRLFRPAALLPILLLASLLGALGTLSTAGPSAAAGAGSCTALVDDAAGILDTDEVTAAASDLQSTGAQVRVRTFTSVPGGDLDRAIDDLLTRCPAWQNLHNPDEPKNNLLVLAVSVDDRLSGLYYGDTFRTALDNTWPRIQANSMNPRFADGDFTGGITAAMGAVEDTVNSSTGAGSAGSGDYPSYDSETAGESSESGAWVLAILGSLLALAASVWGLLTLRRRIRARAAARTAAAQSRDAAATAFLTLTTTSELAEATVKALPDVADSGIQHVRSLATAADIAADEAVAGWLTASETHTETSIAGLSADAAQQAAADLDQVAAALSAANGQWVAAEEALATLHKDVEEIPEVLAAATEQITRTRSLAGDLAADGYRTGAHTTAAEDHQTRIGQAEQLLEQSRYGDAAAAADTVLADAETNHAALAALPVRRADLSTATAQLREDHRAAVADLAAAHTLAADLAATYHPECVQDLTATLAAAQDHLDQVATATAETESAADMAVQDFTAAESHQATAAAALREATAAIGAPQQRLDDLVQLTSSLPGTLDALAADITTLAGLLDQNTAAVAYLDQQPTPTAHDAALTDHRDSLTGSDRPALLTLREDVAALDALVAADLDTVRGVIADHAAAEKALGNAARAVSEAESESSRMHSGSRSKSLASQAASRLQEARRAETLPRRKSLADDAARIAADAVEAAKRAIRDHRRREEEEARRRRASMNSGSFGAGVGTGIGLGGGFGGGGGGGFGGGSSGFGGGGGGGMGGGSSSW